MKKFNPILLLSFFLCSFSAFGQSVVLQENFEGATFPPAGWTMIDNDGDGHCWQICGDSKWVDQFNSSSKQLAVSFCVDTSKDALPSYGPQDNWLISPPFEVKNDTYVLEFVYAAQNVMEEEPMEILISENGGTNVADFTSLEKIKAPIDYDDVVFKTYNKALSKYKGKTIRFAIRHQNGAYGLSVDNVYVYNYDGPMPPTFTAAAAAADGSASVTLTWTNATTTKNGTPLQNLRVNVYRDGEVVATVSDGVEPGKETKWTDTTVKTGNTYVYHLSSLTDDGESQLSAKKATVTVGYAVPKKVAKVVAALNNGTVALQWDAVTAGATSGPFDAMEVRYDVYRMPENGDWEKIAEGLSTNKYTDTKVGPGSFAYTVKALNSTGTSEAGDISKIIVFGSDVADMAVGSTTLVESTLNRLPDINSSYSLYQTIITPADLNYVTGDISKLVFKSSSTNGVKNAPAAIYITPTDMEEFSASAKQWAPIAAADRVFNGTVSFEGGNGVGAVNDVVIELDSPYNYTGGNFVVTYIKNGTPNGAYADRYLTTQTQGALRSFTTSTYDPIDITNLPHSTYSDKALAEVPSVRFIVETKGMTSLSGTVVNSSDNRPVSGATIAVEGVDGLQTSSDSEGHFAFPYISVNATALKVAATGYKDITVPLSLSEGNAATVEVKMTENENYTLKGKVTTDDTGKPAAGAKVSLSGYGEASATVDANGQFSIAHVYSGKEYTLTIAYPTYDAYKAQVNNNSTATVDLGEIVLSRSLIPPFALDAEIAADGSNAALSWKLPTDRDVEAGWKAIGDPTQFNYTGGSYYSTDLNIGHYYSAANLENMKMAGLSVDSIRLYVKKPTEGNIFVKVWQGTRSDNVELAAQQIPEEMLPAAGGWITVKLDNPVELREGKDYIIGANAVLTATSSDIFGQAKGSYIDGVNNLKWGNSPYENNNYNAWCLMAYCNVPGTEADIVGNEDVPDCEYNVYRKESNDREWTKLNSSPVRNTEFTDNSWVSIPAGTYTYAVSAIYKKGESAKAPAVPVSRSVNTDVGVVAFVAPLRSTEMRDKVSVEVKIANFGELPVTDVPIKVSLNGDKEISAVYSGEALKKGESANVKVGEFNLEEGVHTLVATVALEGDESASNNSLDMLLPNLANVDLMGYRWNAYGNAGFMRIPSNNPEGAAYLAEVVYDDALIIAAEHVNDKVYAYTATWYGESRGLVEINPTTWTVEKNFPNPDDIYDYVVDMAYDGKTGTMFALVVPSDPDQVDLVKVNLKDASTMFVGSISKVCRTLAADMEGHLYMIDSTGKLYSVNPETAAITLIGNTGVGAVSYLQSMAFDHNSGRLFWAHTSDFTDGDIYEVNPTDASVLKLGTTLFGGSEGCELVGLYTPYEYPEVKPDTSGCPGVEADGLSVNLDSNGLLTVACNERVYLTVFNAQSIAVYSATFEPGVSRVQLDLASGVHIVKASGHLASKSIKTLVK